MSRRPLSAAERRVRIDVTIAPVTRDRLTLLGLLTGLSHGQLIDRWAAYDVAAIARGDWQPGRGCDPPSGSASGGAAASSSSNNHRPWWYPT